VGDSDPLLWEAVLGLSNGLSSTNRAAGPKLPAIPRHDSDSRTRRSRPHRRGNHVVIRQGATLRQAEFGNGFDRLVPASLLWHDSARANGLGERAALGWEQNLWRRFIGKGLASFNDGMPASLVGERRKDHARRWAPWMATGGSGRRGS